MHYLLWRAVCAFLLLVVLLQYLLLFSGYNVPIKAPHRHHHTWPPLSEHDRTLKEWIFDAERDANNFGLTHRQCDAAFPELYYEIDRSVKLWQDRNYTITQEDTEISWRRDAALRVLVHKNQLRVLETRNTWGDEGYRIRTLDVLSQLHRALLGSAAAGEASPDAEFAVVVDDMTLIPNPQNDTHTVWAFTRRLIDGDQERQWLMPDFNFWSSPPVAGSFSEMQEKAKAHDAYVMDKVPQLVWRGVKWTNERLRGSLLQATEGKAWADAKEIVWESNTNVMPMQDMCQYMFVTHTEGRSWSGRLKYLLNCDSVPIVHELDWTAHLYHLLQPDGPRQNHIRVKRDFSDLAEKVEWYLAHPGEAQWVADNSVATFRTRYLTPAAQACYWRRLLDGWSEVAFTPDAYEIASVTVNGTVKDEKRLRGIAFEEFVHLQGNYPPKVG